MVNLGSKYPHIVSRIKTMWGTLECRQYLSKLTFEGSEVTPDFTIFTEIHNALELHDKEFPEHKIVRTW